MIPLAHTPWRPDASVAGASPELAAVVPGIRGSTIRLPPELSRATVLELLRREQLSGSVVMGPADILGAAGIAPEQWAIIAPVRHLHLAPEKKPVFVRDGPEAKAVFVFPKHTLVLPNSQVWWVLSALEGVKPERLDPEGRPLPWVPAVPRFSAPALEAGRDDDARVDDREVLPECPQPMGDDDGAAIATSTIHEWFAALCAAAGFPEVPLIVRRGRMDARGFVSGSVEMSSGFAPRRIVLTTCPNADEAEIVATLVHEMAHPLARARDHGHEQAVVVFKLVPGVGDLVEHLGVDAVHRRGTVEPQQGDAAFDFSEDQGLGFWGHVESLEENWRLETRWIL